MHRSSAVMVDRLACQSGEDLIEHAEATPALEPVVDRLVRTIFARRITPAKSVLDDEDNPADHPPVFNPRDPMRQREI